jgi:signal transduction histidine kinase
MEGIMDQRSKPSRSRRNERGIGRRTADNSPLQIVRDDERSHIARELHDDLGQLLATLRVDLSLLERQPALPRAAATQVHSMDQLLLSAITSLRRIASNLRPRALDDGSLYFALQAMCLDFARRNPLRCELDVVESELCFNDHFSTAVFRIVQESLTNVARHAKARRVRVSVRRHGVSLRICVEDDGVGLTDEDLRKPHSLGLIGMRERVQALQGEMSIRGQGGTRITIALPLQEQEQTGASAA